MTDPAQPATTGSSQEAALFDVDGTLAKTTVVHYYAYFRRRRMPQWLGAVWQAAYLLKCVYYLVVDKIDRGRFNTIFYRSYKGLPAEEIKAMAHDCHREVLQSRRFAQAVDEIALHKRAGRRVVLVTGSIDFIVAPLADELGVDDIEAPGLVVENGRFTGRLEGPSFGAEEKGRRARAYAKRHGIDLARSHAYGDSTADLSMLEAVGHPHAVNPSASLRAVARRRNWPIHEWAVQQ